MKFSALRVVFAVIVFTAFAGSAASGTGDSVGSSGVAGTIHEIGQPEVTLLYDKDGSPEIPLNRVRVIGDNDPRLTFKVSGDNTIYFVIETLYTDRKRGEAGGTVRHAELHYVLGGHRGSGGVAHINPRFAENDRDAALVEVDGGWLWVSDTPPENWRGAGAAGSGGNMARVGESLQQQASANSPALSWSIITLIRSIHSWGGADATRFIFRVEGGGSTQTASLYNRPNPASAKKSTGILSYTRRSGAQESSRASEGVHMKAVGKTGLKEKKTTSGVKAERAFVEAVDEKIAKLVR